MISAAEALDRLKQGNRRFVEGEGVREISRSHSRRQELVENQYPFAILLGCSDSRVPAELVFDQGLGDLFVIRVAGNIVMPSQIGSVEFAADKFGTRLVVVLGHTRCGAVLATLDELKQPSGGRSPNLRHIVDAITGEKRERFIGWPERLFVKINALIPGLVDRSVQKQSQLLNRAAPGDEPAAISHGVK